jgi:hypothetical protein
MAFGERTAKNWATCNLNKKIRENIKTEELLRNKVTYNKKIEEIT